MATVVWKVWKGQRMEVERHLWLLLNSNVGEDKGAVLGNGCERR